jgi:hypothetical protein
MPLWGSAIYSPLSGHWLSECCLVLLLCTQGTYHYVVERTDVPSEYKTGIYERTSCYNQCTHRQTGLAPPPRRPAIDVMRSAMRHLHSDLLATAGPPAPPPRRHRTPLLRLLRLTCTTCSATCSCGGSRQRPKQRGGWCLSGRCWQRTEGGGGQG